MIEVRFLQWKTVQIPEPLFEEVKRVHEKLGYASISSFVSQSIRDSLKNIKSSKEVSDESRTSSENRIL